MRKDLLNIHFLYGSQVHCWHLPHFLTTRINIRNLLPHIINCFCPKFTWISTSTNINVITVITHIFSINIGLLIRKYTLLISHESMYPIHKNENHFHNYLIWQQYWKITHLFFLLGLISYALMVITWLPLFELRKLQTFPR